ncbi:polysaccharide export protein [Novosphingobium sp. KCTC 2891]|uniref:polysaccharide biosynthesis/export family protein n=1 Tax=Novosphingobium sp. KCTC 2891 TaxID=2989730 RepID=UPI00222390E7|nr:polysaccharide biosynthesis/export family protein [Novosphingobium sp. KCTC 2891]MCW1382712.1 polysaccharide export protein [Novosphingobium sp. KCTC 2891]
MTMSRPFRLKASARRVSGVVLAVVLFGATTGCSQAGNLPTRSVSAEQAVYRLGSGDMLKITVYGEENLTGSYPVNGEGQISFPLLGTVDAKGKTQRELEAALTARLGDGFVNNPSVTVEVANFRPYYILGEVNKAGEFPFVDGLTAFSAVARAGGFTYRADQKRVFIRHHDSSAEEAFRLDGGTPVLPGDTIRIPERRF